MAVFLPGSQAKAVFGFLIEEKGGRGRGAFPRREREVNDFVFENSTKAVFGKGQVKKSLPGLLKGAKRVLLAYGGGSIKKTGIYGEVTEAIREAGASWVDFGGIMPNPTLAKVREGAALARKEGCDFILAVGGGSVMDCAKAVSLQARHEGDIWADFWMKAGAIDFEPLPLGIVVTVTGTGSEMNGGAVITNEETKIKTGRDYPRLNARFAILDPAYTLTVPMRQVLSGAFDSLSHMMEIYFSGPDDDSVSDSINEALQKNVIRNLRAAVKDPSDLQARSNLAWDSTMAENRVIKLGKRTDFECHMIEHQLGAYTDCNHGEGLAVIHPAYYRRILEAGQPKFARWAAEVWGISPEGKTEAELARAGVEALAAFIREVGLPSSLREIGITDRSVLKPAAGSTFLLAGGYRQLTHAEVLEILEEVF